MCFTTVNRRSTKNFDQSDIAQIFKNIEADDEEANMEEMADLPDKNDPRLKDAILPNVLRNLVQKRKLVKDQIKREKDPTKLG